MASSFSVLPPGAIEKEDGTWVYPGTVTKFAPILPSSFFPCLTKYFLSNVKCSNTTKRWFVAKREAYPKDG